MPHSHVVFSLEEIGAELFLGLEVNYNEDCYVKNLLRLKIEGLLDTEILEVL